MESFVFFPCLNNSGQKASLIDFFVFPLGKRQRLDQRVMTCRNPREELKVFDGRLALKPVRYHRQIDIAVFLWFPVRIGTEQNNLLNRDLLFEPDNKPLDKPPLDFSSKRYHLEVSTSIEVNLLLGRQ
jgi:hypothetical protein